MFLLARTTEVLVKELLNQRSYSGTTPLALAARQGHAACVDYLLSVGESGWMVGSLPGMRLAGSWLSTPLRTHTDVRIGLSLT